MSSRNVFEINIGMLQKCSHMDSSIPMYPSYLQYPSYVQYNVHA